MKNTTLAAVLAAALLLGACEDGVTLPKDSTSRPAQSSEVPASGPSKVVSPGTQPPDDVPEQYRQATSIDVEADAGWMSPSVAYGGGIARYVANNATLDVNLVVRNPQGTIVGSNVLHAADSYVFPGSHSLNRSTNVYVSQTCGLIAQATAHGTAWNAFFTTTQQTLMWDRKTGSDSKGAPQPACPVASQPSGGGTYPQPAGPMIYPYTYQISTFTPARWECTYYDAGTGYQKQYCIYWPATYSTNRAPTGGTLLASRGTLAPAALRASKAPALPSVFVIVSDRVPANDLAVIERHQRGPFKNVLLVPSKDIRPAVFAAAMEALYQSRVSHGESPRRDLTLELRGNVQDQEMPSSLRDYASSFTSLIANAKPAFADSYGTTQIVELRMRGNR